MITLKRVLSILCLLALLISLMPMAAFADGPGSGNIDGGGGDMDGGTAVSYWNLGDDGVRVTVLNGDTGVAASAPIDLSNRTPPANVLHFGKVSKLQYRNGRALSLQSGMAYDCLKPTNAIPTIINSSGRGNIEAIKRYFCSEYTCMLVADATGIEYNILISGKYRLLIEPISYFTFNGQKYAATATEAALYDQLAGGQLRAKMGYMSHQNLPLSMFLEHSDLGFSAWTGATSGLQSNANIISYLGLGIVWFTDIPEQPGGPIEAPDVEYRVNTDVVTAVTLTTNRDLTPDNPASVTFNIDGRSYRVNNIVIPGGDSQVVWIKWHTPATPQMMNIQVSVSGAYTSKTKFTAKIVDLNEFIPPDPLATDTNPDYTIPALPNNSQKRTAHWGVWNCYWKPVWVWCDHSTEEAPDAGHWVDEGYWVFEYTGYSASITGSMTLMPDDIVPTAQGKRMKSGYGVKTDVAATLSTNAPSGHFTYTQTAFSVFPEFQYKTYLRLLERISGGRSTQFTFRVNEFSTLDRKAHFSPVWFPDRTEYRIYTQVWDTWTPDGMLAIDMNDAVSIDGSLYDDWYTNRE